MSRPPPGLILMLRLRERINWMLVFIEAHWSAAPAPVRFVLRGLARLKPLRRWIRIS